MKQEDESPIQLSSQERLTVLEEQELEKVMGAVKYPEINAPDLQVPLLSDFQHSTASRNLKKEAKAYLSPKLDFPKGTQYDITQDHVIATAPGEQPIHFKRPEHIKAP